MARFQVRLVDVERRTYRRAAEASRYHDACLTADAARDLYGGDWIVWDRDEERVLYDSRKLTRSSEEEGS
jgi:hypothetical protein